MTDPKDGNLSPIGRKWDNTLMPRSKKWSLWLAALCGLGTSLVVLAINTLADEGKDLSIWLHADQPSLIAYLAGRLGFLPLAFVIGAAIRNRFVLGIGAINGISLDCRNNDTGAGYCTGNRSRSKELLGRGRSLMQRLDEGASI
jgi:hypothetical protein